MSVVDCGGWEELTWMNMDRYGLRCLFWMRVWVGVDWEDAGALLPRCMGYAPPCGYCLEASMTDPGRRPSPLDCGSSPQ